MDRYDGAMSLYPKRHRIVLRGMIRLAVYGLVARLLQSWFDTKDLHVLYFTVAFMAVLILFSGSWIRRGTVTVWDRTITGPGRGFHDKVTGTIPSGSRVEFFSCGWWDRLTGKSVIRTTHGKICLRRSWYDPEELKEFLRGVEHCGFGETPCTETKRSS